MRVRDRVTDLTISIGIARRMRVVRRAAGGAAGRSARAVAQ